MAHDAEWFSRVSQEAFEFLIKKYGFSVIELPQPAAEGEMPFYTLLFKHKRGAFVLLTLAPTKHELELSFGVHEELSGIQREIYLHDFIKLIAPKDRSQVGWGYSTPDLLLDEVSRAAKLMEKYAVGFLEGRDSFWAELEAKHQESGRTYLKTQVIEWPKDEKPEES